MMIESQISSRLIPGGIRILDLSTLITGFYCASLLDDLGAKVIKVEHPQGEDGIRQMGATFWEGGGELSSWPSTVRRKA